PLVLHVRRNCDELLAVWRRLISTTRYITRTRATPVAVHVSRDARRVFICSRCDEFARPHSRLSTTIGPIRVTRCAGVAAASAHNATITATSAAHIVIE